MTETADRRLMPIVDEESREFWDGLARGELRIGRCRACHKAHWYPRRHCPYCYADGAIWEKSAGHGVLYSFTVIRQNSSSAFRNKVPYAVGLIDLDEGARVFGRIIGDFDIIRVGCKTVFDIEVPDDWAMPAFRVGDQSSVRQERHVTEGLDEDPAM